MFYRLFFAFSLAVTFLFPRLGAQGLPGHVYQIEEEGSPKQIFEKPKSEKLKAFLSNINDKEGI